MDLIPGLLIISFPNDAILVQEVNAIGKPPDGKLSLFGHLKNVVVFSSLGQFELDGLDVIALIS